MSRVAHDRRSGLISSTNKHAFRFQLPRVLRLRRHPTTILRTVLIAVFVALPAYVFLSLNAPGNEIDVEALDIQYVGGDGVPLHRPGVAPVHVHVREANVDPVIQREDTKQGVLRRGALQVEGGDQTLVTERRTQNKTTSATIWKIYAGINASYMGCYPDAIHPQQRTLKGAFTTDLRKMTIETCLLYCTKRNFPFAGLQFYSECYCGTALEREKSNNESVCNLGCSGNKSQICGGAPYLSIYQLKNDPRRAPNPGAQPRPQQPQRPRPGNDEGPVNGYKDGYRTCAERPTDDSYFTKHMEESDSMTIQSCLATCEKQNMPLAALFRGSQCHCGYLTHNYTLRHTVEASECQEPCRGDSKFFCGGTKYYAIYQTSVEDSRCTEINMGKEKQFLQISLASFPGSGNTWVRYLIERATGIYTGSYYDDGDLYRKGFRGEREHWLKGNTIAVKTHRFDAEHVLMYDGAILIIRNPYKAIISEHNRKFGGHTGFANEKHYTQGTEWIDFVAGKSRTWTNTALNFLQYSKKILVIHYEDLRSDLFVPLQKMVQFLGLPINEERILCTLSSPDGKFKRRESSRQKLSFDPYTEEMREVMGLYVKGVEMALKIKDQTPLPEEYNPHLRL